MANVRNTLQFGQPAAERESKHLEEYFVENSAFARFHSGPRRILIGDRGSGKSALFAMLARRDSIAGNIAITLAPQDYSYQMLQQISASRVDGNWAKAAAYGAAWKYLMLTLALRNLARIPSFKQRPGKEEKALRGFLNKSRAENPEEPLAILIGYLQRFEDVNSSGYNPSQRTSALARLYELEDLSKHLPLLSQTPSGKSVHIYVDELDLGWDGSEEAQAFVAGLFQACMALNKLDLKLRVYIAVRQELFNNVPALNADAQKYRDLYEKIRWDGPSLFTLITRRIEYFLPKGYGLEENERQVWNRAFSDLSSFRYMLERSLYRPRELIIYCTECLEHARQQKLAIPMTQRTVEAVEGRISRDRLEDVCSENEFQYPHLKSILKAFALGPAKYEREELLDLLMEISIGNKVPQEKLGDWAHLADPYDLMEILWRVGFIRVESDVQNRGELAWRAGSPGDPSVDISTAARLGVMPVFHKALRIGAQRQTLRLT